MSDAPFRKFMLRVAKDESMKRDLQGAGGQAADPIQAVIAFAKSKGYDITADDITRELSEQDLAGVSGGVEASTYTLQSTTALGASTSYSTLTTQLISKSSYYSDRRLKSNIRRVGTHALGIGVYEYDILGRRERGVMADEVERVKPEAVTTNPFGIKMVNYGAL